MAKCKLLIVGFDAMDASILFDDRRRGRWGHLEKVWTRGNWGVCVPEIAATGPSWTTIYTGQSWEQHRVADAWARQMVGTRSFAEVELPFFWDWVNAAGMSIGVVNMPITYPPRAVNGYMVSGFPSPLGGSVCYPEDLPLPDGYTVDFLNIIPEDVRMPGVWYRQWAPGDALDEMKRIDAYKIELLQVAPVQDVMMIQFPIIDHIGHHVQGEWEAMWWLEQAFDHCDKLMGQVLELVPAEYVVLLSDHGFVKDGHSSQGVFAAAGPGLAVDSSDYKNLDVLPMLLALVGIDPGQLPGENRLKWEGPSPALKQVDPEPVGKDGLNDGERAKIEQQLKALGYWE